MSDVVSAIVPIAAVEQLPINNLVLCEGGANKLLATLARNRHTATAYKYKNVK